MENKQKRFCLYCGRPLDVSLREGTKYCPVWHDKAGNRHDCKSRDHWEKNAPEREQKRQFLLNQENYTERIEKIIQVKGTEVRTEDLDAYDIHLAHCLNFTVQKNGECITDFIGYQIYSYPLTNIHKIVKL